MWPLLSVTIAYLLGSIPFGYLIVRAAKDADIRETGSGGTGATNVSRRAGKFAGVITLLLDAAKGATAVLIARLLLTTPNSSVGWWVSASAIAVIVGHVFPVWLNFRGGKGVATGVGVFLMLDPVAVAFAGLVFFLVVWLTRYVSLGSIIGAVTIPATVLLRASLKQSSNDLSLLVTASIGALLIVFAHRENIKRLLNGTESKFH